MKAVFFDRDGVINEDFGYVYKQEDFLFNDGVFELLKFCKERGYLLLLVTNQSGIGMGYYTKEDFEDLSIYMQSCIKKQLGFGFDSIYFCPHKQDDDCICRKPKPGMIQKAIEDYKLNPAKCILIGDRMRDIESAQRAGLKYKILVNRRMHEESSSLQITHLYRVHYVKEILNLMEKEIMK